jgi:hypothetical protein
VACLFLTQNLLTWVYQATVVEVFPVVDFVPFSDLSVSFLISILWFLYQLLAGSYFSVVWVLVSILRAFSAVF